MQAPGKPGPKILFELSQVETGRAVQDLRHGVRAKVGHGIRTLLCLRATRAKSQYKVGLTAASSLEAQRACMALCVCWASFGRRPESAPPPRFAPFLRSNPRVARAMIVLLTVLRAAFSFGAQNCVSGA